MASIGEVAFAGSVTAHALDAGQYSMPPRRGQPYRQESSRQESSAVARSIRRDPFVATQAGARGLKLPLSR
jgi:hypothetical protein